MFEVTGAHVQDVVWDVARHAQGRQGLVYPDEFINYLWEACCDPTTTTCLSEKVVLACCRVSAKNSTEQPLHFTFITCT